jgi:hypothetical protein
MADSLSEWQHQSRKLQIKGVDFLGADVSDKERSAIKGKAAFRISMCARPRPSSHARVPPLLVQYRERRRRA